MFFNYNTAIYSISDELISKNQPIIDVENVVLPKRPYTTYNSTNFPISFCLQDYDQKTYNIEKYFRFEVSSILTSTKNKSIIYKFDLIILKIEILINFLIFVHNLKSILNTSLNKNLFLIF